ncbi:integrase [Adhaeribacter aerolatus]|uniref:Integrase n=1 Tax=Adhaeribacter aerolatus TaxID=670289 RepID=A0A512AXR1_9BACT|nr:site-specific integrase [Adhaeribacter aerolatus]GEO04499.1 integrase [Adhaeribacter aerolatus]
MASVNFNLRNLKTEFETPIIAIFRTKGKTHKIATGKSIPPKYWNLDKQEVKRTFKDHEELNDYLNELKKRIIKAYDEFTKAGIEPSAESLRIAIAPKEEKKEPDFVEVFQQFIHVRETDPTYTTSVIKNYKTALSHLGKFASLQKVKLKFGDLNNRFYESYKAYLFNKQLQPNTVGNQIKQLKAFLNWATEEGYNNNMAFRKFKKPSESTVITVLTEEERDLLANFDLSENGRLGRVRDLFIIGCFTGLRFSDLANLKPENFKGDFLEIRTIKTKDHLRIPIAPQVRRIVAKYETGLPTITNQKANEYLKELGEIVGLEAMINKVKYPGGKRMEEMVSKFKLMTTHMARRTFITIALKKGMPQVTLRKITGHKDLRTMLKYVEIAAEDTHNEMMRIFG